MPETIGNYRVVRRLGRGGMGEVLLARDERLDRLVAIKRILPDAEADDAEDHRERFRREARILARLRHPHIVVIHELLERDDGEVDSIVMEYVEGRSVADLLAEGALAAAAAVDITRQVADGLAFAHGEGLVHRDLKGSNVIVERSGKVRILDFGLAKPIDPNTIQGATITGSGEIVGTYRAMAPEAVRGEGVDQRSDLFALGVLLYEMLTAVSPFWDKNPAATLRNIVVREPAPPEELRPGLPSPLVALLDRLLAKRPEKRPPSARRVAKALREIARDPALRDVAPPVGKAMTFTTLSDSTPTTVTQPARPAPARRPPPRTKG